MINVVLRVGKIEVEIVSVKESGPNRQIGLLGPGRRKKCLNPRNLQPMITSADRLSTFSVLSSHTT
jgi:hypothetical protein